MSLQRPSDLPSAAINAVAGPVAAPNAGLPSSDPNSDLSPQSELDGDRLQQEVNELVDALSARFEEISLIHALAERLASGIAMEDRGSSVARSLLSELGPCIQSRTLAIHLFAQPLRSLDPSAASVMASSELFEVVGESVQPNEMQRLVNLACQRCRDRGGDPAEAMVINDLDLGAKETVRLAIVPIERGDSLLGQMVAIRSQFSDEFGTVEAKMMASTSMMLAVHVLNQRQYLEMQDMFESVIKSFATALDAKDAYTHGHSNRVSELACQIAKYFDYGEQRLADIRTSGILHDIGKIGVDDSVLRKPTKLTDDEFEQIKRHPVVGYEILKGIDPLGRILPAIRHHHERWDGGGYPDGLKGEEIPLDAQIMAVADAFDAMTSDRPYRDGLPIETVKRIFAEGRGTQWSARVVDVLLEHPELLKI